MKKTIATLLLGLSVASLVNAQNHKDVKRPEEWEKLVFGGRFMDRFEPLPELGPRTSDTWGEDAVKPRDITLGIEDPAWSYWGGNIVVGDDGKYHKFVCRWPENHPKGHMAWFGSEVVHAVSDSRFGPFNVQKVIGKGHNPEVYRLADGRYVCYVIGAYYLGETIEGPWERKKFTFNPCDRRIVEGLSNISFVRRADGSYIMVDRGGGIWVSRNGLGPWEQVTQGSNYPPVRGSYEDPVMWKTTVQYHMIVNDWHGRIAYHLRSKDGVNWKVDSGEAYMPGIAVYADGQKEDWYKYERLRMFQDEHGRAIQANFAVIDYAKRKDLPNDIHSSKNLPIPLTVGRLLTLLNPTLPTAKTKEIRLRITAEEGFDPHTDIDFEALRFGSPEEVDFGGGCELLHAKKEGKDIFAYFSAAGHGFSDHNFAGKLLGRTSKGGLLFGYSRLPWIAYEEPILSARNPVLEEKQVAVEITNYGESASKPSQVSIAIASMEGETLGTIEGTCPALDPQATATLKLKAPPFMKTGADYHYTAKTGGDTMNALTYKTERPKQNK
ncbi:MAG: glycoside hydrolase family protein [Verrucomicrobia bacterium]|nr:glycoside hydrolase family protein [Verrucomicrobiota bacterium]